MPMVSIQALEDAYMRHVHGKLEPDELLVRQADFDALRRRFREARRSDMYADDTTPWEKLGFQTRVMFLRAAIRVDDEVERGTVHVLRTGVRLGTEPIYSTVM